jgi:membrane protein DedA with SNARE-associated domain
VSVVLHLDKHMAALIAAHGHATYALLWAIVFCETGLVLTPFLPGDSLLFAAGAFAGMGQLDPGVLFAVFMTSAVLGDAVNYALGARLGARRATPRREIALSLAPACVCRAVVALRAARGSENHSNAWVWLAATAGARWPSPLPPPPQLGNQNPVAGKWALRKQLLNPKHITQTSKFYAKYGGKTVVLARFVPIVRTFAPFVAGIGSMEYPK